MIDGPLDQNPAGRVGPAKAGAKLDRISLIEFIVRNSEQFLVRTIE
jgi:hypothetical protein